MKAIKLIFVLFVLFFISCSFVFAQPFEMIEIGKGADPHWSPDGTKLAFVYHGDLCVANANGEGEPQKIEELPENAEGFAWLDSNEFLVWGRDYGREEGGMLNKSNWIEAINKNGEKRSIARDRESAKTIKPHEVPLISGLTILNDGTIGYWETPVGVEDEWVKTNKVFRIIKQGKLPPDSAIKQLMAVWHDTGIYSKGKQVYPERGIWLESVDGTINKKISSCDHCSFPVLSPDGTKILVVCGGKCPTCVLDLMGNEICVGKPPVNPVDPRDTIFVRENVDPVPIWSPDGKKIAYGYHRYRSVSEDDIEELGSDIYIENSDGNGRIQVTDTPDITEAGPVWSPDGSRIACTDRNTAKIYVIKLK
jgi:hypothetical protein